MNLGAINSAVVATEQTQTPSRPKTTKNVETEGPQKT